MAGYQPVTALVITRSVSPWYRSGRVDKGTDDGVRTNSPVVASGTAGAALVGIVTRASAHTADVAFITDGRTEVGAKIPQAGNFPGLLQSTVPGQLRLYGVPREAGVQEGQVVVTGGYAGRGLQSPYPPGIPVGQVTSVGGREVDVQQTVQVTPYVDARRLDVPRGPHPAEPGSPPARRRMSSELTPPRAVGPATLRPQAGSRGAGLHWVRAHGPGRRPARGVGDALRATWPTASPTSSRRRWWWSRCCADSSWAP